MFSIDKALSLWLNDAAGWKHLAPGGVPGFHIRFKAARCLSPGGLNVFIDSEV